jgi:hypothetical protein
MIESHLWPESDPNISDSQHSVEELADLTYHPEPVYDEGLHLVHDSYHSHDYGHDEHAVPNDSVDSIYTHSSSPQPRSCHGTGTEPGSNPTTVCSHCGGSGIGST